jgi:hypothetical protein
MNFEFVLDFEDFKVVLNIENYQPAREAPICSNPDSPAYCDPGDSEEWDVESAVFVFTRSDGEHRVPVPAALTDYLAKVNAEYISEQGQKEIEDRIAEYEESKID